MLTKAAALEWAPLGIRVNSVHPGYVETPLVHNILREVENGYAVRETLVLQHALGLIDLMRPGYVREGKRHATVAIGCTGGKLRSTALVEELSRRLAAEGVHTEVVHRDLGME